jgi:uncharacterized protein YqeY
VSNLSERIQKDLVAAMKARQDMELSTLRMLKSEIQKAQTEKGRTTELTDEDIVILIQRLIKQRHESAEQYSAGGAADRAAEELKEATFLEVYLPEQLSDVELDEMIEKAAAASKATGPKDMGRVMGRLMGEIRGRADGKRVKTRVQSYLQSLVD